MASSLSWLSRNSFTLQAKFDVFLSFRGEDTRDNFTSHLYAALRLKQIETFIDDSGLQRGDEISPVLLKAIESSKISVVIFSKDYTSSRWCLDELVQILECRKLNNHMVIPVFYNINPSDVRKQGGSFEDAFDKHEERFKEMTNKVQKWRVALTEAANLSGWDSSVTKPEAKLVDEIVRDILKKLKSISTSNGFEGLVGLESRIERIKSLLCIGLSDFRVVGIWGMGGIGKTTIAGALFNQISYKFEGFCFIANVREESEKQTGLYRLREQVLSQILEENLKIGTLDIPQYIQERLRRKKVFIVLDDVDNLRQLEFLAGGLDWFGVGSRIIITTRDKQVLYNYGVDNIYEVEGFNDYEALSLFCKYAFKQNHPTEDLMSLAKKIIEYANGNPLPLKVLGSFLFRKSKKDWENAVRKLKRISNPEIHKVLKISYDGLDHEEQNVFLDIACFFKGANTYKVTEILDDCYLSVHSALGVLIDKSLITISHYDKLQMHDLVQEMGWEIVRLEYDKKPGKRSRLWYHEDVTHVLENNKGTDSVEGIFLDMSKISDIHLHSGAFKKMSNLRLLEFYHPQIDEDIVDIFKVHLPSGIKYLPRKLRYLYWAGCPMKSLPPKFSLENLVHLKLPHSNVKQLWKGRKHAFKLKSINLCNSQHLIEIPDLSEAPQLEIISLIGCRSLIDVPSSVQYLHKLQYLCLSGCKSLKSFPSNIHFISFITLDLSDCISLTKFPQISGNVKELFLSGTAIEEVPSSISCLIELVTLDLSDCTRLKSISTSICKLKSLFDLYLMNCSKLESFPEILEEMEHLEYLCFIDSPRIKELPSSIEHLNGLHRLDLTGCKNLEKIPSSICNMTSLSKIDLSGCSKLDKLPENLGNLINLEELVAPRTAVSQLPSSIVGWEEIKYLDFSFCNLMELPKDLCSLYALELLDLRGNNFESLPTSVNKLSKLEHLYLSNCNMLRSLPELPSRLRYLEAMNCRRLQSLPKLPSSLEELDVSELEIVFALSCPSPFSSSKFVFTNSFIQYQNGYNILADSQLRIQHMAVSSLKLCYEKVYKEITAIGFYLPGSEIPDWFSYQSSGSSITCKLPRDLRNRSFIGFAICAVIVFESSYYAHEFFISCDCQFGAKYANRVSFECHFNSVSEANMLVDVDHILLGYVPFCDTWLGNGDYTTALFGFSPSQYFHIADPIEGCKLKCCGVCPLYLQSLMNQPNIFIERLSATNEDLLEIMSEECAKIGEFHDAKISGSSSGRSEENEVEPHPKRICRNQINAP